MLKKAGLLFENNKVLKTTQPGGVFAESLPAISPSCIYVFSGDSL